MISPSKTKLSRKDFLKKLEAELKSLPLWSTQTVRENSWMTSQQIEKWAIDNEYYGYTEKVIERFLISRWEKYTLENIRPAKYPHSGNLCTLWGHIKRVYPRENKTSLHNKKIGKIDPRFYFSQRNLLKTAPLLFISHTLKDFKHAVQVSNKINKDYGYRTWLCEQQLKDKAYINEEIRHSISQCDTVLILLTYQSLGSAYVHTEVLTAHEKELRVIVVIKNDDTDIQKVVDAYIKMPSMNVLPLLEKYKKVVTDEHQISRYKKNAENLLSILKSKEILLYPSLPAHYKNSPFKGFGKGLYDVQKISL